MDLDSFDLEDFELSPLFEGVFLIFSIMESSVSVGANDLDFLLLTAAANFELKVPLESLSRLPDLTESILLSSFFSTFRLDFDFEVLSSSSSSWSLSESEDLLRFLDLDPPAALLVFAAAGFWLSDLPGRLRLIRILALR